MQLGLKESCKCRPDRVRRDTLSLKATMETQVVAMAMNPHHNYPTPLTPLDLGRGLPIARLVIPNGRVLLESLLITPPTLSRQESIPNDRTLDPNLRIEDVSPVHQEDHVPDQNLPERGKITPARQENPVPGPDLNHHHTTDELIQENHVPDHHQFKRSVCIPDLIKGLAQDQNHHHIRGETTPVQQGIHGQDQSLLFIVSVELKTINPTGFLGTGEEDIHLEVGKQQSISERQPLLLPNYQVNVMPLHLLPISQLYQVHLYHLWKIWQH